MLQKALEESKREMDAKGGVWNCVCVCVRNLMRTVLWPSEISLEHINCYMEHCAVMPQGYATLQIIIVRYHICIYCFKCGEDDIFKGI